LLIRAVVSKLALQLPRNTAPPDPPARLLSKLQSET